MLAAEETRRLRAAAVLAEQRRSDARERARVEANAPLYAEILRLLDEGHRQHEIGAALGWTQGYVSREVQVARQARDDGLM